MQPYEVLLSHPLKGGAMRCTLLVFGLAILSLNDLDTNSAADPTHILQPVILEVAPTQANGNPWDTGIGAYGRPDPAGHPHASRCRRLAPDNGTVCESQRKRFEYLEKKMRDSSRDHSYRCERCPDSSRNSWEVVPCNCLAAVWRWSSPNHKPNAPCAKFMSDTPVANDTLLAKFTTGSLSVKVGDK